jgi:hypothetical protein
MAKAAWTTCLLAVLTFTAAPIFAKEGAQEKSKAMGSAEKATYLVTSPHTKEECMAALVAVAAKGPENLENWRWGCMAGDHTGYAFIKAESETSALQSVPENVRSKARTQKVDKVTMDQIKQAHQKQSEHQGY